MQEMVSNLVDTVRSLQQQVSAHDELFRRLNALEEENSSLKVEVERLRGLLSAPSGLISSHQSESHTTNVIQTPTPPKRTPSKHPKMTDFMSRDLSSNSDNIETPIPSWATIARRIPVASRPPPSVRKFASAARAFSPADPSAAKGFEFVYLARKRKFTRSEVRTNLRRLGVDTSRLLDISFPARSCVGLLVHAQYLAELKSLLAAAKVVPLANFDPIDPVHLADPLYAGDSLLARSAKIHEIHADRCIGVLGHVRPHLVSAIGAMFVQSGWLVEEDVASELRRIVPVHGRKRHHTYDEEMGDAPSVFANAEVAVAEPTQ